uniref:Reverse transcriptase/retrotransposon-derived protein RNase H-like domain-containing protein n=1 Tax=Tanacetum cinerariifolium TaxID=118510 RepID=A0A6L2P096_TANCI|nr:hypothetical protein [Tanacetum cinerariifolium]
MSVIEMCKPNTKHSLLSTPLCCDNTHDVTPCVSALAGCDRSVSEPQKNQKYEWGVEQEEAFQTLKENLCNTPILLLPDEAKDFTVYCDASNQGGGLSYSATMSVRFAITHPREAFKEENSTAEMLKEGKGVDKTYYDLRDMYGGHSPLEALCERMCRSPVLWAEIRESKLIGLELVQETTDKVVLIKEKLKAVRDSQKSYTDNRRNLLEFEVKDQVLLNVLPWKDDLMLRVDCDLLACSIFGMSRVLEWIGWVCLPSVGMDRMGMPTKYLNGSDGYTYPVLEWIGWVRLPSIGMDWMGTPTKGLRTTANEVTDSFLLKGLEKSIEESDLKSCECEAADDSDSIRHIENVNTPSVGYNPKNCSSKHDDALWAFRISNKTPTGCTPFKLVYGKACHLPVEIEHKAYWTLKQCNMDLTAATKNCFMKLNELMELRDGAYEHTRIYKERTKKWHDSRLYGDKNFKVGDKVFLFNSRFKMHSGKLKSRWYGPNVVKIVYLYGTIEIIDRNRISFKVNGQRLKKYHVEHTDAEDKEVVEFEENTT